MNTAAAGVIAQALSGLMHYKNMAWLFNRPHSTSQWVSAKMSKSNPSKLIRKANARSAYLKSKGLAKDHRWTVRFYTFKRLPYVNLLNAERNQRKARGKKRVRGVPKVKEEL